MEALIALIGVIVGAASTTGYQEFDARRQVRRRRKIAARVMLYELGWIEGAYTTALEHGSTAGLQDDANRRFADQWGVHHEFLHDLEWSVWQDIQMVALASAHGWRTDVLNRELAEKYLTYVRRGIEGLQPLVR